MNKIFANSLIIPDWLAFTREVEQIYDDVWDCNEGTVRNTHSLCLVLEGSKGRQCLIQTADPAICYCNVLTLLL